jgi:hypothetical protein
VEVCTGGSSSVRPNRECGTAHVTAHNWSRWVVVRCQLLIDSFKFKFDCLNMNRLFEYKYDCFLPFEIQKIQKKSKK